MDEFEDEDDLPLSKTLRRIETESSSSDDSHHLPLSEISKTLGFNSDTRKRKARKFHGKHPIASKRKKKRTSSHKSKCTDSENSHSKQNIKQKNKEGTQQHLLKRILEINGYELDTKKSPRNGDCFFTSIIYQLNLHQSGADISKLVSEMRNITAEHFLQYIAHYLPFFKQVTGVQFLSMVNYLRNSGYWSGDINDAVPLAMANILQMKLIIFTSCRCMVVEPSMRLTCTGANILQYAALPGRTISLAYVQDHYDSVIKKEKDWNLNLQSKFTLY